MRAPDMFKTVRNSLLVLLAAMPLLAIAAPSAHEVVQQTTETLLAGHSRPIRSGTATIPMPSTTRSTRFSARWWMSKASPVA